MLKMIGAILISFVIISMGVGFVAYEWNSTPTATLVCKQTPPQHATSEDLAKAGCEFKH